MERKGRVCLLFLRPSNREIWGRVDCEKKKKSAGKCQPLRILREISTIENGAGIQNSGETKTRLSLSLCLFLCLCVMADDETSTSADETSTFVDVASHTNEYSIFQDRRGVCCKQGFVSGVETGF